MSASLFLRDCKTDVIARERSDRSNLHKEKLKEYRMAKKNKQRSVMVNVTSSSSRTEFNPDYTHVKKDLARIGTLAGFFILVLVALSFFLK
jgi:hypothetical protein